MLSTVINCWLQQSIVKYGMVLVAFEEPPKLLCRARGISYIFIYVSVVQCTPKSHLPLFLQGVHVGNITAEGESSVLETNNVDWRKNSRSVPQKKSHSPLKHSGSPRKKAEQESRPHVKPTGWTCGECLQWFPERDSYVSHVKTTHRKVSHCHPIQKLENSQIGGSIGAFFVTLF